MEQRQSTKESSCQKLAHDIYNPLGAARSKDVILQECVSFSDLRLSRETLAGLHACGFVETSPIQLKTIPLGRCGFDLVVQSKAGTGKTCIFTVIALEALHDNKHYVTQTLVIAPTREIALQIYDVFVLVGSEFEKLNCAVCIGGTEVKQDRITLNNPRKPCQIVIGTPGRLKQLIELNILKTHQIELLVLDEADKLMDDQFKAQVDDIYKRLPLDKQMIVTSATYPNELAQFLEKYMQICKFVRLGEELALEAIKEFYTITKAGQSMKMSLENKIDTLKKTLYKFKFSKCFIFTNYQARAPIICDKLNKDASFFDKFGITNYICAELSQDKRTQVFNDFKQSSHRRILVSTDVSARGIDIYDTELVVNLDLPADNATYYHRIGRAGRFGQPGTAVTIVSSESVDQSIFKRHILSERMNKLEM